MISVGLFIDEISIVVECLEEELFIWVEFGGVV